MHFPRMKANTGVFVYVSGDFAMAPLLILNERGADGYLE